MLSGKAMLLRFFLLAVSVITAVLDSGGSLSCSSLTRKRLVARTLAWMLWS